MVTTLALKLHIFRIEKALRNIRYQLKDVKFNKIRTSSANKSIIKRFFTTYS